MAFEQFGHDVRHLVVRAEVVHRKDVSMIELAGGARFLFEPMHSAWITRELRRNQFDRDVARQPGIARRGRPRP
jgi:hypothetical protein